MSKNALRLFSLVRYWREWVIGCRPGGGFPGTALAVYGSLPSSGPMRFRWAMAPGRDDIRRDGQGENSV